MALSFAFAPSFPQYSRLPCELRLQIIEACLQYIDNTKSIRCSPDPLFFDTRGYVPLPHYATVNREWKAMVEKRTFRSLTLRVGEIRGRNVLDDFERICVGDRVEAISKIHLTIFLSNSGSWNLRNVRIGQDVIEESDDEPDLPIVHAERVATEAFGNLFQVLKTWSRNRGLLPVTYELLCQGPRSWHLSIGTHLRIDSSNFPQVACIGSFQMTEKFVRGIQPASMFQMLTKLPNVEHADIALEDDFESSGIVQCIQEENSTGSFQESRIKSLSLEATALWYRKSDPRFHSRPPSELSQSIFTMTSRLEELYLEYVVDVPFFLRQACKVSGNNTQGPPAWPNMKTLCVKGYSSISPSDDPDVAADLYDSVTKALPHLPNITRFDITVVSPFEINDISYLNDAMICIEVPPRDDRSAMRDGRLILYGLKPDQETLDTWQQIARSQWYCKLASCP